MIRADSLLIVAACAVGSGLVIACAAFTSTAQVVAPVVVGAACQLAADQGAAEPGWEVDVCTLLDPNGKPTNTQFLIHVPKGATPKTGTP